MVRNALLLALADGAARDSAESKRTWPAFSTCRKARPRPRRWQLSTWQRDRLGQGSGRRRASPSELLRQDGEASAHTALVVCVALAQHHDSPVAPPTGTSALISGAALAATIATATTRSLGSASFSPDAGTSARRAKTAVYICRSGAMYRRRRWRGPHERLMVAERNDADRPVRGLRS